MVTSTLVTLGYRFAPYTETLDPAGFGVVVAAAVLGVQRRPWKRYRSPVDAAL